jgi:uncharacterized membrane protein YkvA (DUF1232 family)
MSRIGRFQALVRYYKDPEASVLGKLVIFVALFYAVWPVDLIPDVPVIGWLDDIGVMGLAMAWLGRVVSRYRTPSSTSALPQERPSRRPFSVSP